jgi:hypothetical protein
MRAVVLGGGAAGFFAAIRAAECCPEAEVLILERSAEPLSKVRISGGGRCNLTHACWEPKELVKAYPRGAKELLGPFHRFAPGDTLDWFARRGLETKIEEDGRIFPVSDRSESVVDCLLEAARLAGAQLRTRVNVSGIAQRPGGGWLLEAGGSRIETDALMVACGASPALWDKLAALGLAIVEPLPSLFTFNLADSRTKGLEGLSAEAEVSLPELGLKAEGPLLITHWGLSGPAVLRLSAWGARGLAEKEYRTSLKINWTEGEGTESLASRLSDNRYALARKQVENSPPGNLPARLWARLVQAAGLPEGRRWADLSAPEAGRLASQLCEGIYYVDGKSTFKEEFVTTGGVDLREIDFRRFAAKRFPGLFMAGEVLDIDAITGGYNFQAAWTGGWIAGEAMAEYVNTLPHA